MMQFNCTNCGRTLSLPETYAGRVGRCKSCGAKVRVPENSGKEINHASDDIPKNKTIAQPDLAKETAALESLLFKSKTGETLRSQLAVCGVIAAVIMGVVFGALIGSGFGSGLAGAVLGGITGCVLFILCPLVRNRLFGGGDE